MKKIFSLLLLCLLLLTATASASRYPFWLNPASQALRFGARGVIVSSAEGNAALDSALLSAANAGSPFISWQLAGNVNSSLSPEELAAALGRSADFFLTTEYAYHPEFSAHFAAKSVSYEKYNYEDITMERTDSNGRVFDRRKFRGTEERRTEYLNFAEKDCSLLPVYCIYNIYDSTGTLIFTYTDQWWDGESYFNAQTKGARNFFKEKLPVAVNRDYGKLQKAHHIKGTVWSDPATVLRGKNALCIAPVAVSEPLLAGHGHLDLIVQQAAMREATEKLKRLNVTYQQGAPLSLEIMVTGYRAGFIAVEPRASVTDRQDTRYEHWPHRHDRYQDRTIHERHWSEVSSHEGYIRNNTIVALSARVVDNATGRIVFTYSCSYADDGTCIDACSTMLQDMYKQLGKKLGE